MRCLAERASLDKVEAWLLLLMRACLPQPYHPTEMYLPTSTISSQRARTLKPETLLTILASLLFPLSVSLSLSYTRIVCVCVYVCVYAFEPKEGREPWALLALLMNKYMYERVCVSVCVCEWEKEREEENGAKWGEHPKLLGVYSKTRWLMATRSCKQVPGCVGRDGQQAEIESCLEWRRYECRFNDH